MMWHNECGGLVYYDSLFTNESFIDLACISCGKRWFVPKTNALARRVLKLDG